MPTFTVHEPPPRGRSAIDEADRVAFIDDGFSWGAALFNVFWMLRHRMWLVAVLYVAGSVVLFAALAMTNLAEQVGGPASLGLAVLLGMEGAALRRWTLARKGWREVALIVAPTRDEAERRFFAAWSPPSVLPPPLPPVTLMASGTPPRRPADPGIIGFASAPVRP